MGKIEDEFNRQQMARQTPSLLRGESAPPLAPAAQGEAPRAALLRQPLPSPGENLRNGPSPVAGLQQTMAARAPAVAAGERAMESAAYRASLPQSNSAGLAATIAERAVPMTAQADAMAPMQRGAPDPDVRARLMQAPPPGAGLHRPPDPGVRARLTQAPPTGAGLAQTIAERAASRAASAPPGAAMQAAAMADPITVAPNRTPSAPAKNPIVNPNTAGGLLSEDAAAYQASRAGAKIPDQVGVNKDAITGVDANKRPIPNTGARPTVPNMPPNAVPPERAGMIARLRQAAGLGGAAPGGAGVPPGAAPGAGAAGAAGGAGAPPPPPGAPPAGAAGAAGPAGQPGGIRGAAQSAFGSGQQWGEFGRKVAAKAAPVIKVGGAAAKVLGPVAGAVELGMGLAEGDAKKAGWGAADTAAGLGLWSPAAPVAATYLAGRGAWEGGKMLGEALPESTRDNIGSGLNRLVRGTGQIFGQEWGVNERLANQYAEQRKADTIAQAARAAQPPAAAPAAAAAKKAPPAAAPAAGPVAAAAAVAPAVAAPTPRAAAQQQGPSPLMARYRELQAAQDASPIAFTTMGGGQAGMQVHFKDGTVSTVGNGGQMPQELADFNDRHKELGAISSGRATASPAGAPAPTAPAQEDWHPNRKTLHAEAVNQGYDPARAMMISAIETGGKFDAAAQNPKSSAFGLVQMTKANRDSYGFSDAEWKDPAVQARTGIDFMKKTDAGLARQLGRAPSPAESYMGHLFGVSGAATVLAADPNAPLLDVVKMYDPKRANAIVTNNGMKGLTTGQAIAKWTALADRYMQQVGGASAAAPAQGGMTLAEMQEMGDGPIQMIRGLEKTMLAPNGNGYNEVPQTVYDAARMQGNVKAGVGNYLDNVNQGWNNYNNPKAAKLEEQALQNAGALNVANTTGGYHLAGQQLSAEAQKAIAAANVEAGRGEIKIVPGPDGIDQKTGMPVKGASQAVYMKDGVPTYVPQPAQAAPARTPSAGSIEILKKSRNDPAVVSQFEATYGAGSSAKYLN